MVKKTSYRSVVITIRIVVDTSLNIAQREHLVICSSFKSYDIESSNEVDLLNTIDKSIKKAKNKIDAFYKADITVKKLIANGFEEI